jgi:hypothetical protein
MSGSGAQQLRRLEAALIRVLIGCVLVRIITEL